MSTDPLSALPGASVVMCVLNEERHLRSAVRHALDQDYPGELEVVVALGPSTDSTDEIAGRLAAEDPRVRLVTNPDPRGATPAGLNRAIAVARHPVIVRADGHALLPPHYVRVAVETLVRTGADNVGGVMAAEGTTDLEQAIARAMSTRFGVGNAAFHTGGSEGPADTVYLGSFRRAALERVGGYDEGFLRAQDWEMNHRIRESGGLVWFQPALRVSYLPRSTLRALSRQYFHYGRWRRVVARRHEGTVSVRYLAPPLTVLGVGAGLLVGAWWRPALLAPAVYGAAVIAAGVRNGAGLPPRARAALPLVYATMHMSWGCGFLSSPAALADGVQAVART